MWRVETKHQNFEVAGVPLQNQESTAYDDKGVSIEENGALRSHTRIYKYRDLMDNIEFKFYATRYDANGENLAEYYTIEISRDIQNSFIRNIGPSTIEKIKRDIAEGLMVFPIPKMQEGVPLRGVKFV